MQCCRQCPGPPRPPCRPRRHQSIFGLRDLPILELPPNRIAHKRDQLLSPSTASSGMTHTVAGASAPLLSGPNDTASWGWATFYLYFHLLMALGLVAVWGCWEYRRPEYSRTGFCMDVCFRVSRVHT